MNFVCDLCLFLFLLPFNVFISEILANHFFCRVTISRSGDVFRAQSNAYGGAILRK